MAEPDKTLEKSITGDFDPKNFLSSFFQTARAVLLSPRSFYKGMKTEGGLRNPFLFLISCVLIVACVVLILAMVTDRLDTTQMILFFKMAGTGIAATFLIAGIHFFVISHFFKAPGTYEMAFRVNAYAAAIALFSWIPIPIMILFLKFYEAYLITIGLSRAFSIKISQAFITVLVHLAVVFFIFYLLLSQRSAVIP